MNGETMFYLYFAGLLGISYLVARSSDDKDAMFNWWLSLFMGFGVMILFVVIPLEILIRL